MIENEAPQYPGDWTKKFVVLIDLMIQIGALKVRPLVVFWPRVGSNEQFAFSILNVRWMRSDHELALLSVFGHGDRWIVKFLFVFAFGMSFGGENNG